MAKKKATANPPAKEVPTKALKPTKGPIRAENRQARAPKSERAVMERSNRGPGEPQTASGIRFSATLLKPAEVEQAASWMFLILPKEASAKLPSRGMVSVEGTFNSLRFQATLEPDGQGGHWLKVDQKMREGASAESGDTVKLEIAPMAQEPEPTVPADLHKALAAAHPKARVTWSDITPAARRDFIHWIVSAKQEKTRAKRIATACDMLAKGKRRPCCFDRSGMYDKSLSCPTPHL